MVGRKGERETWGPGPQDGEGVPRRTLGDAPEWRLMGGTPQREAGLCHMEKRPSRGLMLPWKPQGEACIIYHLF